MRVSPEYLQEQQRLPGHLERLGKVTGQYALSKEAATKYRSSLGRVAWSLQSRPRLARFGSLLAQGQQSPDMMHEHALRQTLMYLKGQLHLHEVFPSPGMAEFSKVDP